LWTTYDKKYTGLHVKCSLFTSNFYVILIFSASFRKILKYHISPKSFLWEPTSSLRTDRETGVSKLIVGFSDFANAPKHVY